MGLKVATCTYRCDAQIVIILPSFACDYPCGPWMRLLFLIFGTRAAYKIGLAWTEGASVVIWKFSEAKMKLLLIPVLCVAFVAGQPLDEAQMKKAEGFALGCLEQHKSLTKEHLLLLKDGDFSKVDAETKCFLRCFLQQAKFMDASGKLLTDYAIERLSVSREKSKVEALVKKCSVEPSEDSCETAYRAVECYHQEKASLL